VQRLEPAVGSGSPLRVAAEAHERELRFDEARSDLGDPDAVYEKLEAYEGGGGYTAAKHGVHALAQTLRLELLADGVRVTEIAPGLVETEFSLVRFGGDAERAAAPYRGLEPLHAEDVADAIAFCATRPAHVDIDYLAIKPTSQATAKIVHRRE